MFSLKNLTENNRSDFLEELDLLSSSSEAEDFPQKSESLKDQEEEEDLRNFSIIEDSKNFFQYEICSDEEPSVDEKQHKLDKEMDYFEVIANIPRVDDISIDITDELIVNTKDESNSSNMGKFVNPLTGVGSVCTENEYNDNKEDNESQQIERDSESDISNEEFMDKDFEQSTDTFEEIIEPIKHESDTFQLFAEIHEGSEQMVLESNAKVDVIIQEDQYLIQQNTLEFLNSLIDRCIGKAEYIDENILIRRKCDKNKLLQDLKVKWELWEREKRGAGFLNRKCVEYFKRKSIFRFITPDDTKTIQNDRKRYLNVLKDLDKLLIREEKTRNLYVSQILNLKDQFKVDKQQSHEEINNFEQLIRQTFRYDQLTRFQNSLNNSIRHMAAIRNENSNVRFMLLLKQHEVSLLEKQMENVNDLGNDLQVSQYESLEAQANALSKNIEERNATLNKLHDHFNFDIHNMAHLKEKRCMLQQTVMAQKQYFHELQNEELNMRKVNTQLGRKRKNVRLELRNLTFQCGLVDKPTLMRDYDETEKTHFNLRSTIKDLKQTVEELMHKLSMMEKLNSRQIA